MNATLKIQKPGSQHKASHENDSFFKTQTIKNKGYLSRRRKVNRELITNLQVYQKLHLEIEASLLSNSNNEKRIDGPNNRMRKLV